MRIAARLLFCLAISWSLALAAMPARAAAPQIKTGCCAQMAKDAAANDCGRHAPKSDDKQCCSMCAFCVALLAAATPLFMLPPARNLFLTYPRARTTAPTVLLFRRRESKP